MAEGITSSRPAPYPGPRCATHHRQRRRKVKERTHEQRVCKTYGLSPGDYQRLYEAQGGRCAICQWATGRSKRLAVDHDHVTGAPRGLLCTTCNVLVGRWGDKPDVWLRGAAYLASPPASLILQQ